MKKLSLMLVMFFALVGTIVAQRNVTGKITDAKGEPLIGANVLAKGTSTGAATDVDGNFRLAVPTSATTLVVSYTGYDSKEIALGVSNVVDIQLAENAKILGEVVVTAIGIQRDKKSLGYAATDLKADEIAQRNEADPIRALSAKVPGVQITGGGGAPGQSTKINIRGFSSMTGNTQPLFVVDGIPFDNSVNSTEQSQGTQFTNRAYDIDPNNIENITILKGAAASALYGSRATNGVILITTKSGKKSRKGLEVTYNSSYSVEQVASLPNYQDVYMQGSNQNYNGGFIGNWGAPFPAEVDRINGELGFPRYSKFFAAGYPEGTAPHPITGVPFGAARYQSIFPELMETDPADATKKRAVPVALKPYNFLEEFFQDGQLMENALTFSGGGDNTTLNATVSRMDNVGIVPGMKTNRTSIGLGGNSKLANGITVNATVNYVNTQQSSPPIAPGYFRDYGGASDASIYGRLFYLPRNYNLMGYPFENPVNGDNVFYRALDNPLWLIKNSRYNSNVNRAFGSLGLNYDVNNWLSLTARGGVNTYTDDRQYYSRKGSEIDALGRIWNNNIRRTELDFNYFATIKGNITPDLDFRLIAGLNNNHRERTDRFIGGIGIITNELKNLRNTSTQIVAYDDKFSQNLYAVYSDLQLSYKNFLYLGGTVRNDWSSTLPATDNSYIYPAVNTAFILSEAVKLPSFIDFAKVRASWAQVGNEATPYQVKTTYRISQPFINAGGTSVNRSTLSDVLKNATLKNELTEEIEFGADVRLFKSRVGIDFAWFKRNSFDQITRAKLAPSSGFEEAIVNAGEVENKGIELALSLVPIKYAGFTWTSNVNFTKIKSLIVDAGEGGQIVYGPSDDYVGGTIHRTGFPYGQIFGTALATSPTSGKVLIDKNSGLTIWQSGNQIIGDPNPDFTVGFINSFSYKGFNLSALLDWRQGGDLFSTTAASLLLRGQLGWQTDREGLRIIPGVYGDVDSGEPVLKDGAEIANAVPISAFGFHFSEGYGAYGAANTNVYDQTIIRLREVSLGYDLPKAMLKGSPFGSFRVSISGRNLWFKAPNMLKDLNLDPEVLTQNADSNVQGFDFGATPTTRRYGVNVNVTF